jgi:hypothetical protein
MENTWSIIAETDLDSYWNAPQSVALKTGKLATPLTDAFPAVMTDVVNGMRTALSARGLISTLALSVPPEARIHACYLIIEALNTRIPTLKLGDDQKSAAGRARAWLADLTDLQKLVVVSAPDSGTRPNTFQPRGTKLVSARPREFTRRKMDGL